jgi:hypothetical protein
LIDLRLSRNEMASPDREAGGALYELRRSIGRDARRER